MVEYKVVNDVGSGKGMLSCVRLIYEEQYGGNVILKVPGCDATRERFLIDDNTFCKLHNTEVDTYQFLQKHPDKQVLYPKVFELEKMDLNAEPVIQGHIIMEHLEGVTHLYCHDSLKPNELEDAVKNIARFHSIGAELTEEEARIVPRDFLKSWFSVLFTKANKELFIGNWKGRMTEWLTSEEAREAIGDLDGILSRESLEKLNDDCEIEGVKEVLCHGDSSFHNLLFDELPDGSRKFRAMIDFQSVNWGNAAQDLSRLFVTALTGKDRRDSEDRLLRVYHDELTRVSKETPFTWDQLKESYKRFFQLHAAIVCAVTPGLFLRTLDTMEEGEEKDKFRGKMIERYVALLEDIHRNKN
uniref:CHK domain-containing protein n=1 Tax=Caenorhabditis tropicalis TaxID=1561998 RepID=A0A1I7V427_9PELO